jgi:hypothetical protein
MRLNFNKILYSQSSSKTTTVLIADFALNSNNSDTWYFTWLQSKWEGANGKGKRGAGEGMHGGYHEYPFMDVTGGEGVHIPSVRFEFEV